LKVSFQNSFNNVFKNKNCEDDSFKSKQPYKYYKIHQCFVPPLTPWPSLDRASLYMYGVGERISMETASLGGLAGFQYLSPNHIIKAPVH